MRMRFDAVRGVLVAVGADMTPTDQPEEKPEEKPAPKKKGRKPKNKAAQPENK